MLAKMSFKTKLIFSYALIIVISFGFTAFFLNKNLEENSLRYIKSSLINQGYLVEGQISAEAVKKEDARILDALVKALGPKARCRLTIINSRGRVLADSEKSQDETLRMENHSNRPEVRTALGGSPGFDTHYSATLRIDMMYIALPIKDRTETIGVLRLALPLESVERTLSATRKVVFIGLLLALGLAFILGSLLAARTIAPINRMINISRKYSEGDFSRRIIKSSEDEIGELAETLNKMAQDIEGNIREIKVQNQKLSAVLSSMIEGVIVVDKDGRIVSVNPTIEKIFGISKKEASGKFFLEAIRNNEISEVIGGVLKKGDPTSGELSLVLPVRKIFQFNAAPIFADNSVSGCLVVIHDITEIRRLETVRSDFVANVSHEIKTPLTSIKGFVETLLEGAIYDKENSSQFLKIIQDHADRLNDLVDDLLSLSHLESKEIYLDKKEYSLRPQVEDILSGFKSQLGKRNIRINNELP